MRRVCVVREGQTEVEFIRSCVAPYLYEHRVMAYPSILRAPSGRHSGGRVTVERLAKFISHQYHESDCITTLVDFYGFQDREGRSRVQLERAIRDAVLALSPGLDMRFLLPYVQMYEFEALLFYDIEQFQYVLDGWNAASRAALLDVSRQFATPKDINDSPQTAPSKRILNIFEPGTYSKTEHGPADCRRDWIDQIRAKCPQLMRGCSICRVGGANECRDSSRIDEPRTTASESRRVDIRYRELISLRFPILALSTLASAPYRLEVSRAKGTSMRDS